MDLFPAYRKLIAAVIGLGLLLLNKYVGVDLFGMETSIVDAIIAVLTTLGVWVVPNTPAAPPAA